MTPCPQCQAECHPGQRFCGACGYRLEETGLQLVDGRYQVLGTIGQGWSGQVLKVQDRRDGQVLALKLISAGCLGVSREELGRLAVEDLREEFRVLGQLSHPNLVRVFDFGTTEAGVPYFTMEHVVGKDFVEHVRGHSPRQIAILALEVCRALEYLHERDVVHHDVKPSNLLVAGQEAPSVKLIDFGLVGNVGFDEGGRIRGTPVYMAPEVFRGLNDPRSDLYSLGVVLYQALTGQPPFWGNDLMAVARQHCQRPPFPPSQLNPQVPKEFERVILRLLAKDPADRYDDAGELARSLAKLADVPHMRSSASGPILTGASSLVGREELMKRLDTMIDGLVAAGRDAAGEPAVVEGGLPPVLVVAGEQGMGKTRVLDEVRFRAQLGGLPVFSCSCNSSQRPFAPLRDLVRDMTLARESERRELIERHGAEMGATDTTIAARFGISTSTSRRLLRSGQSERVFTRLVEFLVEVARRSPMLLLLDDMHLADDVSLRFVSFFASRISHHPVRLIATLRDDAAPPGSPLAMVLAEMIHSGNGGVERLDPFGTAGCRQFIASVLGAVRIGDQTLEHVCKETGGNPQFLLELVRRLVETGVVVRDERSEWRFPGEPARVQVPEGVDQVLEQRLESLDDDEVDLLQRAAVAGFECDFKDLVALADRQPDKVFLVAERLVRRRFLVRSRRLGRLQFRFASSRLKEILHARMPSHKASQLHLRQGLMIEERHGERTQDVVEELAHHFDGAREREKALRYSLEAAYATAELAPSLRAEDHLRRALYWASEDPPDLAALHQCLAGLADACRDRGAYDEARGFYRQLLVDEDLSVELLERVEVMRAIGQTYEAQGRGDRAEKHYVQADRELETGSGPGARQRQLVAIKLSSDWARLLLHANNRPDEALDTCHRALERFEDLYARILEEEGSSVSYSLGEVPEIYHTMAAALSRLGRHEEAIRAIRRSLELMQRVGDDSRDLQRNRSFGLLLLEAGQLQSAKGFLKNALSQAMRANLVPEKATCLIALGRLRLIEGKTELGLETIAEARDLKELVVDDPGIVEALLVSSRLRRLAGNFAGALEDLESGRRIASPERASPTTQSSTEISTLASRRHLLASVDFERAGLLLELGAGEEAARAFERGVTRLEASSEGPPLDCDLAAQRAVLAARLAPYLPESVVSGSPPGGGEPPTRCAAMGTPPIEEALAGRPRREWAFELHMAAFERTRAQGDLRAAREAIQAAQKAAGYAQAPALRCRAYLASSGLGDLSLEKRAEHIDWAAEAIEGLHLSVLELALALARERLATDATDRDGRASAFERAATLMNRILDGVPSAYQTSFRRACGYAQAISSPDTTAVRRRPPS